MEAVCYVRNGASLADTPREIRKKKQKRKWEKGSKKTKEIDLCHISGRVSTKALHTLLAMRDRRIFSLLEVGVCVCCIPEMLIDAYVRCI